MFSARFSAINKATKILSDIDLLGNCEDDLLTKTALSNHSAPIALANLIRLMKASNLLTDEYFIPNIDKALSIALPGTLKRLIEQIKGVIKINQSNFEALASHPHPMHLCEIFECLRQEKQLTPKTLHLAYQSEETIYLAKLLHSTKSTMPRSSDATIALLIQKEKESPLANDINAPPLKRLKSS